MKKLVIFGGPPCTGKSTIGRALGYAHLEMDDARATLLPGAAHTWTDRGIAYRAVLWTAGHLLRNSRKTDSVAAGVGGEFVNGWGPRPAFAPLRCTDVVICDGGFGHEEDRDACRALAQESGAELYLVEFTAPLELLLRRNRERRDRHPGLDLTDARVTEIVEGYPWFGAGLVVECSRPLAECIAAVREYIQ